MTALADRECRPVRPGDKPLDGATATKLANDIPRWRLAGDGKSLSRDLAFPDFDAAFEFVAAVAAIARAANHHPEIAFGWGYARLTLSTHDVGGLSENDFVVAARIDRLDGAA